MLRNGFAKIFFVGKTLMPFPQPDRRYQACVLRSALQTARP